MMLLIIAPAVLALVKGGGRPAPLAATRAALSAQSVLAKSTNPRAAKARPEVDKLVALWPATEAPAAPTPAGQLSAQPAGQSWR